MKLHNVKRMLDLDEAENFSVFDTEGLPRLACDGSVLVLAGDLDIHAASLHEKVITQGSRKLWRVSLETPCGDRLELGGMIGSFDKLGYARPCVAGEFTTYLQESYRRWFDDDAEFYRGAAGKTGEPILVYEGGLLVGVAMPTKCNGEEGIWPPVPFLEDDVLYHRCECDDCAC